MTTLDSSAALKEYVETRFQLLDQLMSERRLMVDSTVAASDLRYQQRFEGQSAALAAAFLAQQMAMTTAFTASEKAVGSALEAAKEAVQAALAAADRAVSKTEVSTDKRFESLAELIKQQFAAATEKIDAGARRTDLLEGRVNVTDGKASGGQMVKEDNKGFLALVISAVVAIAGLVSYVISHVASR